MRLDSWYKSLVDNSNMVPPEQVWDGIQDELDIDMVWGRIDQSLAYQDKKRRVLLYAAAAVILLAATVGGTLFYLPLSQNAEVDLIVEQQEQPNALPDPYLPQARTSIEKPLTSVTTSSSRQKVNPSFSPQKAIDDAKSEVKQQSNSFGITHTIKPVRALDFVGIMPLAENIEPNFFAPNSEKNIKRKKSKTNSVYAGFTGQLANTWLLSSKTFSAFRSNELTANDASFGKNLGVVVGANVSPRLGFKSEFHWISQNKQSYKEYINGKYVSNSFELDYYTLALHAKYLFKESHRSHYVLFGAYFATLQNASQSIDGVRSEITDNYKNFDYGLQLGYEFPLRLPYGLTLSPGVSVKYGLANIFSGNETIPSYLNQTQNASFNFSVSLTHSIF